MKFAWIDTQCRQYLLAALCEVFCVSVNGYRAWKRGGTPERQRLTDAQLLTLIRTIHAEVKGAYGSPRMTEEVRSRGFPASKARVERLMSANGIRARHKRRYRVTTDSRHKLPVAPNVLNRNFTPAKPNQVLTSDITYIWTDEGWLYLAVTLDLFNREVVGWSVRPRMTTQLVTDALTMAWFRRPAPGALHHSDRGSPIRQLRLPAQTEHVRHALLDEPQRQLLGYRADGKLLQQPEERARAWHEVSHAPRSRRGLVRIHRSVLQRACVVIHRSASCRQPNSCATGWWLSGQGVRPHNPGPLEGEKPGEHHASRGRKPAQTPTRIYIGARLRAIVVSRPWCERAGANGIAT